MSKMNLSVGIKGLKSTTTINDIVVPDALRRRCPTGVTWFDDAVGGEGFVPSSVMMLTGTPGAGKTTMLLMLASEIMAAGHVCLYNSGEESLYQVKMVTERLGLKGGFYVGQDLLAQDVIAHAEAIKKANPGKQVFILQDSLQTLDDGKWKDGTNSMTALRCTEMLVNWAKSKYGVVIFIGQVNKDGVFQGKNGILHAVDVKGHIRIDEDEKSPSFGQRLFEITKNRYGVSGRTYILGMGKKGLSWEGTISYDNK